MRSTGFVVFSVIIHMLCFTALALTPTRTVSPDKVGESLEVRIGEPAEKPGVQEAPPLAEESKPQAVTEVKPAEVKPEPKPEPKPVVKPEVKETKAPVKKAPKVAVVKTAKAKAAPVVDQTNDPAIAKSEEAAEPAAEVEAAAPTEDKETEAKSDDVQKTGDPAPVGVAEEEKPTGELAHGGASKEGAVSYLDLRQAKGNKPPVYPTQARLEKRQGQLELIYRVTKEGRVADIQVAKSSGHKDLDNEAIKAIAQFRFIPGQEGWASHPVSFTLKGAVVSLPSRLRSKGAQAE
jgi:protein TonB